MAKAKIPSEVKEAAIQIIEKYNNKKYKKLPGVRYYAIFKSDFLYLNRVDGCNDEPVSRLRYNGKMTDWDFAIFRWSSERYDEDVFMMPGSEYLDGSIEGALKAGDKLYPPESGSDQENIHQFLDLFKKMISSKK